MDNKEGLTKRPLEDVDCSAMKRPRGSKTRIDVRVLLQSKNAGAIIGKCGNNIKRLRNDFKANITVPDCSGPERILTVSTDLETALECLLDIIPSLEEYKQFKNEQDFDCEMRILVHQSQAGCIIGRAGFKVKELREKTGANIKIYSLCCPQSTDRVVAMSGHPPVVTDCIRHIYQLLEAAPPKGVIEPYDPHNFEEFYANDYGGFTFTEGGRGRFPRGGSSMRGNSAAPLMGQQIRGRSMMSGGNGGGGGGGGNGGMNRGGGGTSGLPSLLGNANCRNNIGMRGNAVNSLMRNPVGVMNGSMGGGPSSRCSGGMGGRNDNQPNYYGGNQQNFGVQNYSQNRLNSGGMPNQQNMLFGRGHN